MAYLKRQFKTIGVILIPLAIVVFLTSTAVQRSADGGVEALSFAQSGVFRTLRVRRSAASCRASPASSA